MAQKSVAGGCTSEHVPLSQLIDIVNDRSGTNSRPINFFDDRRGAMADDGLRQAAAVNPATSSSGVQEPVERLFVERMDQNEAIL